MVPCKSTAKTTPKRFHLNGHTVGFRPQTQKLELHYILCFVDTAAILILPPAHPIMIIEINIFLYEQLISLIIMGCPGGICETEYVAIIDSENERIYSLRKNFHLFSPYNNHFSFKRTSVKKTGLRIFWQ